MLENELAGSTGEPKAHGQNVSVLEWAVQQDGFPFAYAAQALDHLDHPLAPNDTKNIVFDPRLQALQYAHQGYGEGPDAFERRLEGIEDPDWNPSVKNRLRLGFYTNRAARQTAMAELTGSKMKETDKPYARTVFLETAECYKAEAEATRKKAEELQREGYTLPQEIEVRHLTHRVIESHIVTTVV